MMQKETEDSLASRPDLWVGAAFLITLIFFWPTLVSFPATWGRYGMSHGWLVALMVLWLAWRDRNRLVRRHPGTPLALGLLLGMSVLWLMSTVAHIQLFHQAAFVLVVLLWGYAVFGTEALRTLTGIGLTFLLALPFWEVFIPVLRPATTLASGFLVRVLGIPAEIQGDLITIQAGSFLIADGCSGLRYLLAGMVVAALYSHLFLREWKSRLSVIGLAAAIAILGNWVRVAAVIIIGDLSEMRSPIIEAHGWVGWVVFTVGLVPFFFLAGKIGRPEPRKDVGSGEDTSAEGNEIFLDHGRRGIGMGRLGKHTSLASLAAVLGPVLFFTIGSLPAVDQTGGGPLSDLETANQWRADEPPVERPYTWHPAYFGADTHETVSFTDGESRIYGDRFVYRDQTQGGKLVGFPNLIAPDSNVLDEGTVAPLTSTGRKWFQQAVILTPEGPILTWWWYRVGGKTTSSVVYAKVLEVPAFFSRRRTSELIAISAECEPESCSSAFDRLRDLIGVQQ